MTLALCGWSIGEKYSIIDNPSNRYSKDEIETLTSGTLSFSAYIQPSTWVASGSFSLIDCDPPQKQVEIDKKRMIEIDIQTILKGLGRLEIVDET